jgi:small-conductance mechanosensitive channel
MAEVACVISDPPPAALLSAFAPDGLELTLAFWVSDPANGQLVARSDVNLAVLEALTRLGVNIPYPQREVRMMPPPPHDVSSAAP